jgi:AcrR family transcriptional regulator
VSPSTLYRYFAGADDCLLAAHQVVIDSLWDLVESVCGQGAEWTLRLATALQVTSDFLVAEPAQARLLCPDLAVAVPAVAIARERFLKRLAGLLREGRKRLGEEDRPVLAAGLEGALLGALAGLLGERVTAGRLDAVPALAPEMAELLAWPYREAGPDGKENQTLLFGD